MLWTYLRRAIRAQPGAMLSRSVQDVHCKREIEFPKRLYSTSTIPWCQCVADLDRRRAWFCFRFPRSRCGINAKQILTLKGVPANTTSNQLNGGPFTARVHKPTANQSAVATPSTPLTCPHSRKRHMTLAPPPPVGQKARSSSPACATTHLLL